MVKLEYKTAIDAHPERVWNILWNDATYPQWTAVFAPGSRVETDWKAGSTVRFLDGKGSGLVSEIAESRPPQYMSFRHLGVVKDGVDILDDPEHKSWAGSLENYTLRTVDGRTELSVDMDTTEESAGYFEEVWPKALERVKELAEQE